MIPAQKLSSIYCTYTSNKCSFQYRRPADFASKSSGPDARRTPIFPMQIACLQNDQIETIWVHLVLVYVQNMDLNLWSDFTCLYNGDLFMKCEIWTGPNFIKENTKENRRSKIINIERLIFQFLYTINFGPPIFLCIFLYEIWAWSDFTFHE